MTLHPHPVTVLRPDITPSYLTSLEDRLRLMRDAGASWVLPLTFTSELSEVTAEELAEAFHRLLHMRLMVLGPDAAFGRGAPADTPERMRGAGEELGFDVVQIEPILGGASGCSCEKRWCAGAGEGSCKRLPTCWGRSPRAVGGASGRPTTSGFPRQYLGAADRARRARGLRDWRR